jgi:hypothetical protein
MTVLEPGQNPREVFARHRERGPKVYGYTIDDIARVCRVKRETIRAKFLAGRLRIDDIGDVAACVRSYTTTSERFTGELVAGTRIDPCGPARQPRARFVATEADAERWRRRFPSFDLWSCPACGPGWLHGTPGYCEAHGGARPLLRLDGRHGHFTMLIGDRYVPYHQLVLRAAAGFHVHHADFNRWNNRPGNLVVVTPAEHGRLHFAQARG